MTEFQFTEIQKVVEEISKSLSRIEEAIKKPKETKEPSPQVVPKPAKKKNT